MHRHMRIHEKELNGGSSTHTTPADPGDSPVPQQSVSVLSLGSSRSPRSTNKKQRGSSTSLKYHSGWPTVQSLAVSDNGKAGLKRKLSMQAGTDGGYSPVKRFSGGGGAVDLRHADRIEACSDETSADDLSTSASSSQQVYFLHSVFSYVIIVSRVHDGRCRLATGSTQRGYPSMVRHNEYC